MCRPRDSRCGPAPTHSPSSVADLAPFAKLWRRTASDRSGRGRSKDSRAVLWREPLRSDAAAEAAPFLFVCQKGGFARGTNKSQPRRQPLTLPVQDLSILARSCAANGGESSPLPSTVKLVIGSVVLGSAQPFYHPHCDQNAPFAVRLRTGLWVLWRADAVSTTATRIGFDGFIDFPSGTRRPQARLNDAAGDGGTFVLLESADSPRRSAKGASANAGWRRPHVRHS
jgi:hypothetical protein